MRIRLRIVAVLLLCCGCVESSQYTGKVRGTVSLDGKPLTTGKIVSSPMDGGRGATATIKSDGTFVLQTSEQEDGLAPGTHGLAVLAFVESEEAKTNPEADRKPLIPTRYLDPGTSGLMVEVVAGEERVIDLELQPR